MTNHPKFIWNLNSIKLRISFTDVYTLKSYTWKFTNVNQHDFLPNRAYYWSDVDSAGCKNTMGLNRHMMVHEIQRYDTFYGNNGIIRIVCPLGNDGCVIV